MRMTQIQQEETIKEIVQGYFDLEKTLIFLFGSRAGDDPFPFSDYDVGIYTGHKIPPMTLAKIKDKLEDYPIPVDIDLVDFSRVSDEFKQLAIKGIKIWNRPRKDLKLI